MCFDIYDTEKTGYINKHPRELIYKRCYSHQQAPSIATGTATFTSTHARSETSAQWRLSSRLGCLPQGLA